MTTELIIRIFIAALLGGAIGLEREYRAKEAGFRTHFLVALGSALFMVISQYGFGEVLSSLNKASFDLWLWHVRLGHCRHYFRSDLP